MIGQSVAAADESLVYVDFDLEPSLINLTGE